MTSPAGSLLDRVQDSIDRGSAGMRSYVEGYSEAYFGEMDCAPQLAEEAAYGHYATDLIERMGECEVDTDDTCLISKADLTTLRAIAVEHGNVCRRNTKLEWNAYMDRLKLDGIAELADQIESERSDFARAIRSKLIVFV